MWSLPTFATTCRICMSRLPWMPWQKRWRPIFPPMIRKEKRSMIISSHEDVVRLSGSLDKNQWSAVKEVADMLLKRYAQGVVIDCADLTSVSEGGTAMFLDAVTDVSTRGTPIVLANLPPNVLAALETVPVSSLLSHVAESV